MNNKFNEYINRHSKYKNLFCEDIFLLICRISYILGEPIQYIVRGFHNLKENK